MTMILKNFEKKENNTAAFTVASDPAEFEKAVNAAYLKSRKNINIPGFRKGKAPRQVIEGMYGRDVFYQDAMDEVAPEAYAFAVKEKELRVVGQPRITDVNVTDDRAVEFTFDVSLYPEVTLGEYKGVKAVKLTQTVTDDEVDAEIAATQKRNARMLNVDRPAEMGDTVNINFEGFLNGEPFEGGKGENHPLELGSNSFVPGFVTFPKEYTPELAGKAVVFHVVINEVSSPEYPELDDEFAQDVSEFDTFEEYKADVRATLQKRMDDSTESAFKDAVVQKACDAMTVEIPDVMVEEKVDEFLRQFFLKLVPVPDKDILDLPFAVDYDFLRNKIAVVVGCHGVDANPDVLFRQGDGINVAGEFPGNQRFLSDLAEPRPDAFYAGTAARNEERLPDQLLQRENVPALLRERMVDRHKRGPWLVCDGKAVERATGKPSSNSVLYGAAIKARSDSPW